MGWILVLALIIGLLAMLAIVAAVVQTAIEILPAPLGCLVMILFLFVILAIIF